MIKNKKNYSECLNQTIRLIPWKMIFLHLLDSCYQSADDCSDSPNIKIGCRDSYCNVIKSINTLTKGEESEKLIIQLINQIQNLELQKEYLDKFKKNLLKD